jgi:drug/metabolite transporter superfamily protein YnfA
MTIIAVYIGAAIAEIGGCFCVLDVAPVGPGAVVRLDRNNQPGDLWHAPHTR